MIDVRGEKDIGAEKSFGNSLRSQSRIRIGFHLRLPVCGSGNQHRWMGGRNLSGREQCFGQA